jgi:hypothetical protein
VQRFADQHLVVYLDHRPFVCCIDRWEGLHVVSRLQLALHTNRVHLMKA